MSQCHRKIYLASSSMLEPEALLGFSSLCSTTLGQTWQAIKWKKKINLFPLHLFKKLLICCLPMKGSPLTEGPIGRHCSCETPANPWLHSNAAHLFHGDTSFSDPTYLWCVRGDLKEGQHWNLRLGAKLCRTSDMGLSPSTRAEGQEWSLDVLLRCLLMWRSLWQRTGISLLTLL